MSCANGKMNHVFKFDANKLYVNDFQSKESKEALEEGDLYWKFDGRAGCVFCEIRENKKTIVPYFRLDNINLSTNNLPSNIINIPSNPNGNTHYHNGKIKHKYFLQEVPKTTDYGLSIWKRVESFQHLDIMDYETCEYIGIKQNNSTPYIIGYDVILHNEQKMDIKIEKTFDGLQQLFDDVIVEGIICKHENGKYFKIRSENMGILNFKECKKKWIELLKQRECNYKTPHNLILPNY